MNDTRTSQTRANQRARLLELLKASSPDWVPIREVLNVAGFQYGARIFELRRLGHRVENDPGRAFRLISLPSATAAVELPQQKPVPSTEPDSLFGDLQPGPRYPD
jgi:hypothetical protein